MDKNELLKTIESYSSIVLFGHIRPDGDCFGAQVAMKLAINANYPFKKVFLVGSGMEKMSDFLCHYDKVDDKTINDSLGIALDFNDIKRSEDERIINCKQIIVIDHHNKVEESMKYFSSYIIDKNYSSCSSLLFDLFKKWNFKLNKSICEALFFGIASDTNRFLYLEKDFRSFYIAGELIKQGIDCAKIYGYLQSTDEKSLKIKGYILSNYKVFSNKIIYCFVDKKTLDKLHYDDYVGHYVNLLANVDDYEVWALFVETNNHKLICELRSKEKKIVDVAKNYGGGGHDLACGMSLNFDNGTIDDILNKILDTLEREP